MFSLTRRHDKHMIMYITLTSNGLLNICSWAPFEGAAANVPQHKC
jgi:hypothetical protein